MSYMDMLPRATPTTAEERIRSIRVSGAQFTEYETLANGDVLGAVRAPTTSLRNPGWGHWFDVVIPADGGKARLLS